MGEEEKKKEEGDLVSVRRGMCKGGKVVRGGGESTHGREKGTHTQTHTNCTHGIILHLDDDCISGVWFMSEDIFLCLCLCLHIVQYVCVFSFM